MGHIQQQQSLELVSEIENQVKILAAYEQKVPQIEIDIVKENLRKLYELVDTINQSEIRVDEVKVETIDNEISELLNVAEAQFSEKFEMQLKEQEDALEEQVVVPKREPEIPDEDTILQVHRDVFQSLKEEKVVQESVPEVKDVEPVENVKTEKKLEPRPELKTKEELKTAELKVKTVPVTAEEPLERKVHVLDVSPDDEEDVEDENVMGEKLKKKAIGSLKTSIGINDKFMIINDLFEGNAKKYNKSIQSLDSQPGKQEALYLLGDMKDENLWETTDPVFQQLKSYVERRYL